MLRSCVPSSLLSMRALARISSDLVGCVKGAPLPQHVGDSGQGCLVISKYVVAPMVACQDVCKEIRVRDNAVQLKGSSMQDVADFVRW
jgi:hypothetical protein